MGQTREQRIVNQVVGKPRIQERTPIASDMFLPNHSGIKSHPEVKSLVGDYIKKDGTTTTTASVPFAEGLSASKSISTTKQFVSTQATGTAPFSVSSTTKCTNLNADQLDGLHVWTSGSAIPNLASQNTWGNYQIFSVGIYCDTIYDKEANNYLTVGSAGVGEWTTLDSLTLTSNGGDIILDTSGGGGAIQLVSYGTIPVTTNGRNLQLIGTKLELADNYGIIFGTTSGNRIGTSTAQKIAFHNSTPVIQRANASQAATATTASTNVVPYGYTTSAQADAIVTLVNEIRACLVEKGLMKGSA